MKVTQQGREQTWAGMCMLPGSGGDWPAGLLTPELGNLLGTHAIRYSEATLIGNQKARDTGGSGNHDLDIIPGRQNPDVMSAKEAD